MADVSDTLWEIHQALKRRGLPEMDDETLKTLAQQVGHPQVQQALQSGQVTADTIAEQVQQALQASAEGGFVNDQSGGATNQVRSQLGLGAGVPQGGLMRRQQGGP